jgi:hypothetical protein
VFVSSVFRTAEGAGSEEISGGEDSAVESVSGTQEESGNVKAESDAKEISGNLQAESDVQRLVELLESAGDGESDVNRKNTDVEDVSNEVETNPFPDRPRYGNLGAIYGKLNWYTRRLNSVCVAFVVTSEEYDWGGGGADGTKTWIPFLDSADNASLTLWEALGTMEFTPYRSQCVR